MSEFDYKAPNPRKTGTTIAGIVYKVSNLEHSVSFDNIPVLFHVAILYISFFQRICPLKGLTWSVHTSIYAVFHNYVINLLWFRMEWSIVSI